MGDIFDQVAAKKPGTGDIFDQVASSPSFAPPSGAPTIQRPPNPILSAPMEEGAGESFLNAASPAGATGQASDIWNGPKQLVTHPLDSLKLLAGAYNDQSNSELNQAKTALANKDYVRAGVHGLAYAVPFVGPLQAKAAEQVDAKNYAGAAGTTAGIAAPMVAGEAIPHGVKMLNNAADNFARSPVGNPTSPINDIVQNAYSKPGDHIAASLRSNTRVDVPAEAKIAAPAIEEGLNDRGFSTKDFTGRNGPQVLQSGIDNALDIQEARAKSHIDPIRGERVEPQVLAQNPELAARFPPEKISKLTYGDLDAERIKLNQELRRGNFYSKAPSAQYAVADPMADAHAAANQARSLVYDKTYETTGADLRPLKQTESALIKLGDLAETTKNTLSAKGAQYAVTPLYKKVGGTIQSALSVKANPVNAFSIPEKAGLFNPLNEFNSHMEKAFPNLDPTARASRTAPPFPRYNLSLTSPGDMPPALQRIINLSGGEHIPGGSLKLSHPEGATPPAPNAQEPLNFGGGHHIPAGAIPDILGRALISHEPFALGPPGDMPPALQRVLPYTDPGIRSDIFPGAVRKK
jgi:hypothetical protein